MREPDRTQPKTPTMPARDEVIVLASASPRRRAMMEYFGVPFEVIPSELSEFFAEGVGKHYLGKPKDRDDAVRMIKMLSGRAHYVYTGVCLRRPDGSELYDASMTRVAFVTIPPRIIERYVDSGEPMDKAGGYAMQGLASVFISRIEGSPTGVIGFPLTMVGKLLLDAGFDLPLRSAEEIRDWYDVKYAAEAAQEDGD